MRKEYISVITKNNIIDLVQMNEIELKNYLHSFLEEAGYDVMEDTDDYLIAKGKIDICLVAHLDTVFPVAPVDIFYDESKNVVWSPNGLGADDRAGVAAIIDIVNMGLKPHIIFTRGEEIGGIGARMLSANIHKLPFYVKYFIELDRAHDDDCVFYSCDNRDFIEYIKKFGFNERQGSFTDISVFMEAYRIAGVNLSVGYENEHTNAEYLKLNTLEITIMKVCELLRDEKNVNKFRYIKKKNIPFLKKCAGCGKDLFASQIKGRYQDVYGNIYEYCKECDEFLNS